MKNIFILITLFLTFDAFAKTAIVMKRNYGAMPKGAIIMIIEDDKAASMKGELFSTGAAQKIDLSGDVASADFAELESVEDSPEVFSVRKRALTVAEQKAKARKAKIALGKEKSDKCQAALNFMNGETDGLTEAQVDAMETLFAGIYDALKKNRLKKAKRLINDVTDPTYSDLKSELLTILN